MLAQANVIDGQLMRDRQGWAGLRNVLVQVCTALDLDRVHAALQHTARLRRFHAIIAKELASGT